MNINSRPILCKLDSQRDSYLKDVLDFVLDSIQNSVWFCDATFVLTGSLARGEGSVIQTGGGYESLSDMEFLVTHAKPMDSSSMSAELVGFEARTNENIQKAGFHCKIEFTYASQRFFETARPSIFSHELKEHGKIVYGSYNPLSLMRIYSSNEIPRIDAFYLLCNRVLEQLQAIRSHYNEFSRDNFKFRYAILKFYVDLATSALIFLGKYESTYEKRRDSMLSFDWIGAKDFSVSQFLVDKIDHWTAVKLLPTYDALQVVNHESALAEWAELAEIALSIWSWEFEQLIGRSGYTLTEKCGKLGVLGGVRITLKAQAKYFLLAMKRVEIGLQAPFRYLYGNPRHKLYAEAVMAYNFLAGHPLLTKDIELNQHKDDFKTYLNQIDSLVHVWKKYFRNA